jgi:hypothetical protein
MSSHIQNDSTDIPYLYWYGFTSVSQVVQIINDTRMKEVEELKQATEFMSQGGYVTPWDELPPFKFISSIKEQTCGCGNVYKRTQSCNLCEGRCLAISHSQIYEGIHVNETYETCCKNNERCTGCRVATVFRYKFPVESLKPIQEECFSKCSCYVSCSSSYSIVPDYDPYLFGQGCTDQFDLYWVAKI